MRRGRLNLSTAKRVIPPTAKRVTPPPLLKQNGSLTTYPKEEAVLFSGMLDSKQSYYATVPFSKR